MSTGEMAESLMGVLAGAWIGYDSPWSLVVLAVMILLMIAISIYTFRRPRSRK